MREVVAPPALPNRGDTAHRCGADVEQGESECWLMVNSWFGSDGSASTQTAVDVGELRDSDRSPELDHFGGQDGEHALELFVGGGIEHHRQHPQFVRRWNLAAAALHAPGLLGGADVPAQCGNHHPVLVIEVVGQGPGELGERFTALELWTCPIEDHE